MTQTTTTEAARVPEYLALLEKWNRFIWRAANGLGKRHRLEPAEVYQSIVEELLASRSKFNPDRAGFGTWITLIARQVSGRICQAYSRRVKTVRLYWPRQKHGEQEDGFPLESVMADPTLTEPGEELDRLEQLGRVRAALAMLPPDEQHAIRAHFWHGHTRQQLDVWALNKGMRRLAAILAAHVASGRTDLETNRQAGQSYSGC